MQAILACSINRVVLIIQNYIGSMRRRYQAVINALGGHNKNTTIIQQNQGTHDYANVSLFFILLFSFVYVFIFIYLFEFNIDEDLFFLMNCVSVLMMKYS